MITKLNAIKKLDAGDTIKGVATDLGVGEKCNETPGEKRKFMRTSDYEKTSKALFLWFTQQRSKGTPISGPILQEKAVFFRNQFKEGEEDFAASVDNAPSHPDDDELRCGEIRAIFFPANVTSLIQSMNQGVLENLKKKYRHRLLQHLVQSDDESVADVLRDVVYWIADSWEEVQPTTVIKS
ncbi:jerky protein homolog-like [Parasteatoda tepidariorum]|uniref:jerky protein homolog-like n=1 Tax=Parasteatoda tepidariorum TaxID=114398 RepID=UPI0039BD834F